MNMKDAFIVAYGRSPIGKANKGILKDTWPDEYAAQVIKGTLAKVPQLDATEIDDFLLGCAFPEAEQGMNMARTVLLRAGLPESVPAATINRFCSSGLQTIAMSANNIMAGQADVVLAGGVESMSMVPMLGNILVANPYLMDHSPHFQATMGITAENVAEKYEVTRQEQDEFACESHQKAARAQAAGRFDSQIVPIEAVKATKRINGYPAKETAIYSKDEGIRGDITVESLSKLKPVFKAGGSVTPGNSSQMSDGAAMALLMSGEKVKSLGVKPLAKFKGFAVAGVAPEYMGIGPIKAIPKVLKIAGLSLKDIGLIELNEAFASQAIACIKELGLNKDIVNVNGGAIALGHPLGCTGAFLTAKLLSEMKLRDVKYGMVSMCIGGGMGAAAIFEAG